MKTTKTTALIAIAAMLLAGRAMALSTSGTLADLAANDGSIGIGDKVFSDFTYVASGLTSFNAEEITVTASIEDDVYYLSWGGNITLVSGGTASADLLLTYTVTALDGQIDWIDQSYTGSAQGLGPNSYTFLAVDENVYDGPTVVANSHLQLGDLSDPFAERGDDLIVDPGLSSVYVTKDINLAVVNGGLVTVSQVRQSFHQTSVPDGGLTVSLLGLALAGIALVRRATKA